MTLSPCNPSLIIIFGGTGDLARRKLLPALARLGSSEAIHSRTQVLALGRRPSYDDASFRVAMAKALTDSALTQELIDRLCQRLHFQVIGEGSSEDYAALASRIETLEAEHDLPGNRVFYLALPPPVFGPAAVGLGKAGLNQAPGWTRLVVEKPFGHDLASAQELNQVLHQYFDETQIYRIDHYLGKDPVQNLLVFRFANAFLEALWNRNHIDAVQITASESLGVGTRAGYYDKSGAIRDMVQNHLTQLLTLVAMEPPSSFDAAAIRREKIKVLESIAPLTSKDVIRGQYVAGEVDGEAAPGYLDAQGVPLDSTTETFVALNIAIDTWRWSGVPFYLRTGKRLPRRHTEIAIRYRSAPVGLFKSAGVNMDTPDVLLITLQPNEGFSLHLDVKVPGSPFKLRRIPLSFEYEEAFTDAVPEAYQTLLHDVLSGDQTLFVHADEVEGSWGVYAPILDGRDKPHGYPAGSWGPEEAEVFSIGDKNLWRKG